MQYINNKKREELKKEFEGFMPWIIRHKPVQSVEEQICDWFLNKAEELVAERVQAIREEIIAKTQAKYRLGVSPSEYLCRDEILSLPSLTPKK